MMGYINNLLFGFGTLFMGNVMIKRQNWGRYMDNGCRMGFDMFSLFVMYHVSQ